MTGNEVRRSISFETGCCNALKDVYNYSVNIVRVIQKGETVTKKTLKIIACVIALAALGFGVWKLAGVIKD